MSRFNKMCTVLRAAVCAVFVPFAALAYNVTYDCGDGTGTPPATDTTAVEGEIFSPVMVLKNSCQKTGYVLSGWKISDSNQVVSGSFTYQYSTDKTLTAQWAEFDPKFTIMTTNMPANSTFKYWQGAEGLFYVDWGDGALQTINGIGTIEHTYVTAGVHTIRFDGLATDYTTASGDNVPGAVSFGVTAAIDDNGVGYTGTPLFVAGIFDSLGTIYPSLQNGNQPKFISTFDGCAGLTGYINSELFSGVNGNSPGMFYKTFNNTQLDTECPCGAHSVTTAGGMSTIDGRAVCAGGLKSNEHFYNGTCVTECDFATSLNIENGDSYPLLKEQVTTPSIVVQNGGIKCYVPLESGADSFNLKWGNSTYHAGSLDPEVAPM